MSTRCLNAVSNRNLQLCHPSIRCHMSSTGPRAGSLVSNHQHHSQEGYSKQSATPDTNPGDKQLHGTGVIAPHHCRNTSASGSRQASSLSTSVQGRGKGTRKVKDRRWYSGPNPMQSLTLPDSLHACWEAEAQHHPPAWQALRKAEGITVTFFVNTFRAFLPGDVGISFHTASGTFIQ